MSMCSLFIILPRGLMEDLQTGSSILNVLRLRDARKRFTMLESLFQLSF